MIDEQLLYRFGAYIKFYKKEELIFEEGSSPHFYYQIKSGSVKLNNYKEDGKEFIQSILLEGESFAESLLFLNFKTPMNAIALEDTEVVIVTKSDFFHLLHQNPEISIKLNIAMSERLYYKYIMLLSLSCLDPNVRLINLLNYWKNFQRNSKKYEFKVPFTRQQIADLTGLCVETVIRASRKLAKDKIIKIQNRKIYY